MPIYKVQKRNGSIVDFDIAKIIRAITLAIDSLEHIDTVDSTILSGEVCIQLEEMYGGQIPTVEQIQDVVEDVLIHYDYPEIAKAYILYREKRRESRETKDVVVEVQKTIGEYLARSDWRVQANSNQGYSIGGMILNSSGKVTANYWLSHIYPKMIGDAHRNGDYHIHDLDMLAGYCAGWSLRTLLEQGFNGVSNKVESGPPKHLSSAVAQMVNFLGTLQNEWAGAQAFSSFDTYMAPYVKKYELEIRAEIDAAGMVFPSLDAKEEYVDNRVYAYVYQHMQSFVFNLNIPSRWGTQTPFTNITLDWIVPDDLKDRRLHLGGEDFLYTFGELQKEMDIVNKAFIAV
ncbi:ribonucleoside triphosphate reductase, partial [Candidatus Parcubacteria bacterium]|nr:ribonucleoside triphosphate reductase [Candidatus Parcubacteria bacterium]